MLGGVCVKVLGFVLLLYSLCVACIELRPVKSPLTSKLIRGVRVYLKRDDLRVTESGLSGNKGRKLSWLSKLARTPQFPSTVASCGGTQSNALGALARLLAYHNEGVDDSTSTSQLIYFVNGQVPKWMIQNPLSNFKTAMIAKTVIESLDAGSYQRLTKEEQYTEKAVPSSVQSFLPPRTLWIPQGGACAASEEGILELAREVEEDIENLIQREGEENDALTSRPWIFLVASGTGTIAYYSHLYFRRSNRPLDIRVCTVPCVASAEYLIEQMGHLKAEAHAVGGSVDDGGNMPRILSPKDNSDAQFAKPRSELLNVWKEISDVDDCVFDLVYAPRAFEVIFQHLDELSTDYNLVYYHCGGAEGNEAMIARYRRMGMEIS